MLNLISCELLKLKRSKMVLISVAGVLSTPLLMLIEALQTHFDKPEIIFTFVGAGRSRPYFVGSI